MRLDRRIRILAAVAAIAAWTVIGTAEVAADHCGGSMDISPASGAGGTTFLIESNIGAATDLSFYRDGRRVFTVRREGPIVRYRFQSRSGDAGAWRVEAHHIDQPACGSEGTFTITGLPSTSTLPATTSIDPVTPGRGWSFVVVAGVAGAAAGWWRSRRSTDRTGRPTS